MINPFDAGGYTLAEMTTAINILPNIYTRLGEMGLFRFEGVTQRSVIIEQAEGVLNLLPTVPLGGPATVANRDTRSMRSFTVPWIPHDDVITPAGHPGRPRLRGRGRGRSARHRHGAQDHPHAGQARADPGIHGDQCAARRRQGRRRRRRSTTTSTSSASPSSRSTSCSGPPAPTSRPSAARCCATSRPSSRARP